MQFVVGANTSEILMQKKKKENHVFVLVSCKENTASRIGCWNNRKYYFFYKKIMSPFSMHVFSRKSPASLCLDAQGRDRMIFKEQG